MTELPTLPDGCEDCAGCPLLLQELDGSWTCNEVRGHSLDFIERGGAHILGARGTPSGKGVNKHPLKREDRTELVGKMLVMRQNVAFLDDMDHLQLQLMKQVHSHQRIEWKTKDEDFGKKYAPGEVQRKGEGAIAIWARSQEIKQEAYNRLEASHIAGELAFIKTGIALLKTRYPSNGEDHNREVAEMLEGWEKSFEESVAHHEKEPSTTERNAFSLKSHMLGVTKRACSDVKDMTMMLGRASRYARCVQDAIGEAGQQESFVVPEES